MKEEMRFLHGNAHSGFLDRVLPRTARLASSCSHPALELGATPHSDPKEPHPQQDKEAPWKVLHSSER